MIETAVSVDGCDEDVEVRGGLELEMERYSAGATLRRLRELNRQGTAQRYRSVREVDHSYPHGRRQKIGVR